jgi:ubiquitin-conjugating enzyme E2 W
VSVGSNIRVWIVTLTGADGTLYAGEKYKLKMIFPKDYPTKPPSVYFLKPCPRHVHVYTNGDICLNLLGRDWRPTMTAESLAVSILSMLSSAKEKRLPQDNAMRKF